MGRRPLLAELHAHTTWSDGTLNRELVDLYGSAGFDVLAITDHVVRSEFACHVRAETYRDYLAQIDTEAERARKRYGMLVLPGLELTVENRDPGRAGHAVAVGLREFVSVDGGLEAALCEARDLGAALIGVSTGLPSGSFRSLRPATSTCPSTSSPGRRCSPGNAPKARSSRDSARACPAR
jgi:predicted metal-dependent phosphoesterase TrpH